MKNTKIIAIANQKGGVGKTTTVVNIAAGLAAKGEKVLCVDLDPQGNLSDYLGYDCNSDYTITELLKCNVMMLTNDILSKAVVTNTDEKVDYIPANISLSSADMFLATVICRENILHNILRKDFFDKYSYILIDCLPSLGILVTNALAAADSVLVPVQLQKFALDGIRQFEEMFNLVKNQINPTLQIEGILETMCDNTNIAKDVDNALLEDYGNLIYSSKISRLVEAANSTATHSSLINAKNSRLGKQYEALVDEILAKERVQNVL